MRRYRRLLSRTSPLLRVRFSAALLLSAPLLLCAPAPLHPCSCAPLLSIYLDAIFFKCSRVKIESLRF